MTSRLRTLIAIPVLAAVLGVAGAARQARAPYQFRYHGYEESTAMLRGLAEAHPGLAKVYSIGRSATGTREIWCIEVTNAATGSGAEKPGMYLDGNQHASEVMGGEVTLYLAHHLLQHYGRDPDVTRLLDTRVLYIVQRADPDGAEAHMTGRVDWDPVRAPGARDADGDGRVGEDGPEDIDGDGQVLRMRRPDPDGDWTTDAVDSRLMVRRVPGTRPGQAYRVDDEGLDNDGDGRVNEDPPVAQFISNRNYPAFWASDDGRYRGGGDYPLQEPNARLLVEFILAHPNIGQIESWHTTSGIHLRPYAARPDSAFPPLDLQDYTALLSRGTAITGYPVASVYNDFTEIQPGLSPDQQPGVRHGVFVDWAYVHQGIFAVTTELWTLEPFLDEVGWGAVPRDRPLFAIPGRYNRPDVLGRVLQWLDRHAGDARLSGEGFVAWRPYTHPTLGPVEIGGFTRYVLRNPPPGPYFEKVAVDQARFAVLRGLATPRVRIREVTVERDRGGSGPAPEWRVTATVANEGYLDTSTEQARIARQAKPVEVRLDLPAGASVAEPARVTFEWLRGTRGAQSASPYTAQWRVSARPGDVLTVVLVSEKGGVDRRRVTIGDGLGSPRSIP